MSITSCFYCGGDKDSSQEVCPSCDICYQCIKFNCGGHNAPHLSEEQLRITRLEAVERKHRKWVERGHPEWIEEEKIARELWRKDAEKSA